MDPAFDWMPLAAELGQLDLPAQPKEQSDG